ncbi:MAG: hypothetical protein AB1801_07970 [Chloroflexota bacterium]
MTDMPQPGFVQADLDDLQRVQVLTVAFQRLIANLDANEQHDDYNEQFNHIRFEALAILRKNGLDSNVPKAMTKRGLAERGQKVTTRLSGIVILGVMLALVGLGINSIILEDFLINSLGCLVSSGGMLLVMGAFVVWGVLNTRRRLTNMGDLYLCCDMLIQELNQVLKGAMPAYTGPAEVEVPRIPSAVTLAVDSLEKQAVDWREKLTTLKQQRLLLGPHEPPELTANFNFVLRELDRIEYELANFKQRGDWPLSRGAGEPWSPAPARQPDSGAVRAARANTQEMPAIIEPDRAPAVEPDEEDAPPV